MKGKITYISESKKQAKVEVLKKVGPVTSRIAGWMNVDEGTKVGTEFDIPAGCDVYTETHGDYVALIIN